MVIEIDGIYNPLSVGLREFDTAIMVPDDLGELAYPVQRGPTQWRAMTPCRYSFADVSSSDTTVQEYATFTIAFTPVVLGIEPGAYVMVQFPKGDSILEEQTHGSDGDAYFEYDSNL